MTPEELKEIEERCNKATPGPWLVFSDDLIMRAIGRKGVFSLKNGLLPTYMLFDPVKATREDECFVAFARDSIPSLLAYIKELESQISEHERVCSLRTLADGMNKLCPDLVEELIKRVKEYSKKEDEKFSEIMTWLKGKEDESSSS